MNTGSRYAAWQTPAVDRGPGLLVRWLAGTLLAACVAGPVQAAEAPDQLIRDTSETLFSEFGANRQVLEQDRAQLYDLVNNVVVPHFDVQRMSRLVLGQHWRSATPEQQARFASEFQTLLVRTYATALFEYTGRETITIKPLNLKDGDRQVLVQTALNLGSGPPIAINYGFVNVDGLWKIYDVTIDGVSLVTNYRVSYNQIIQTGGIDALIESLVDKNASLAG